MVQHETRNTVKFLKINVKLYGIRAGIGFAKGGGGTSSLPTISVKRDGYLMLMLIFFSFKKIIFQVYFYFKFIPGLLWILVYINVKPIPVVIYLILVRSIYLQYTYIIHDYTIYILHIMQYKNLIYKIYNWLVPH